MQLLTALPEIANSPSSSPSPLGMHTSHPGVSSSTRPLLLSNLPQSCTKGNRTAQQLRSGLMAFHIMYPSLPSSRPNLLVGCICAFAQGDPAALSISQSSVSPNSKLGATHTRHQHQWVSWRRRLRLQHSGRCRVCRLTCVWFGFALAAAFCSWRRGSSVGTFLGPR